MIDPLEILEAARHHSIEAPLPVGIGKMQGVKNVFLDLDDTLWENNLFFLASVDWLLLEGRRCGFCNAATERVLNHWETINIRSMGFGYDSYERSFLMTIKWIVARSGNWDWHPGLYRKALRWTDFLRTHPIVWRPGVLETLPELTKKYKTVIVTKGNFFDQSSKVDRSTLRHLFHGVEVVPHKNPACYHGVIAKYGVNPDETVMVGNSPRSDINMAKAAGLRTVYIPHFSTWFREMEPIRTDGPLTLELPAFRHLMDILES